jgi:DUF1680 family protein
MWNWRMFLASGEARFADIVETVFYNSALSGISLDGMHYFYTNPLRCVQGHPQSTKDHGVRNDYMSVFCCPPNIIRTIASLQGYAYCTSDKGIWVNVYGSNVLDTQLADGTKVEIRQKTNYPWDGTIRFTLVPVRKVEFALMLRIPGWAARASLEVCGKPAEVSMKPGTYCGLNRTWSPGDELVLNLPMTPQLLATDPRVEETRNQVAVKRGPLVYCLESADLPEGAKVSDVYLPSDIEFTATYRPDLLGGVTTVEGQALLRADNLGNELYLPVGRPKWKKENIRLIPYYAWANRGKSDMTVWMPVVWR